MNIEIRQAKIEDWPIIEDFILATYDHQTRYKSIERYHWQYHENPHIKSNQELLPLWIALDGALVIGAIGVQYGTLRFDAQEYLAGWVIDVMIRPNYRGNKLGHKIHDAVMADNDILITLTMATATRRISERAGCVTLGEGQQYSRIAAPTKLDIQRFILERTKYHPWIHRLAHVVSVIGVPTILAPIACAIGHRKLSLPHDDASIEIKEVDQFGVTADVLWESAKQDYPAIFKRDAQHLDWRFGKAPDLVYKKYLATRQGKPVGLLVLRECLADELHLGIISEIFAIRHDEAAWRTLIAHAVKEFGDKVASIEAAATIPELCQQLNLAGFIVTRKVKPTVVAKDCNILLKFNKLTNDWFFTKGDHDWDQVHTI